MIAMLPSWCRQAITVMRAPLVDSRGTKVRDWSQATTHEVTGCSVQPTGTSTDHDSIRQVSTVHAMLYAPPDADIQVDDRIVYGGVTYALNGAPMPWESPTGAVSHIQAQLVDWRQ